LEYAKSQYFVSQIEITGLKQFHAALQKWRKPAAVKADSAVRMHRVVHFYSAKKNEKNVLRNVSCFT
jgi:hypothetical protein